MSYDEIVKLEKKLNEADCNKNLDTQDVVNELFDDKIVIVGPGGETFDKDFIRSSHTVPQKPYDKVVVDKLEITVFDDSAIVHSLNTYFITNMEPFQIIFLRIWRKKDGQWRIVGGSATTVVNT